jgi:hypothetical protein
MVDFVPHDQDVELSLDVTGPNSGDIKDFKFIFTRATDGKKVGEVTGTVNEKKMGSGTWKATGLEGTELSARINWEAKAGKLAAFGRGELVVYYDTIEVVAKDEDGAAVEKALCHVDVKPDPLYTATAMKTGSTRRTDGTGKVVFDDLPPGEVTVSFRTPYKLLEWVQEEGRAREAKIDKTYSARLVWPDPKTLGDEPHKQYVNLPASTSNPEQGSLMKIKVEVDLETTAGGGITGDKLYVKVEFGENNSPRNDDPKPMFGTNEGGAGRGPFVVEKALQSDGEVVEFDLQLGVAGGDEVKISVGGDEQCTDGTIDVVTWRKIWIKPVRVQQFHLPGDQLPEDLQQKINDTLLPVFIEPEYEDAEVVNYANVSVVDQHLAERMGFSNPDHAPFVFLQQLGSLGSPEQDIASTIVNDNPRRLYWVLNNAIYHVVVEDFHLEFRGRTSSWQTSQEDNVIAPVTFQGTSPLRLLREASTRTIGNEVRQIPPKRCYWYKVQDSSQKGDILDEHLEFEPDKSRFRLVLPKGVGIGFRDQIAATVKLVTYDVSAGSSSGNFVASEYDPHKLLATVYTIVHELGHSIKQCASGNGGMPGLPDSHPHFYTGKGHQGSHCNYGLSASNRRKDSYRPLVRSGTHGTCIMFGGVGPKTKYEKAMTFCEYCEPYVKAVKIESLSR